MRNRSVVFVFSMLCVGSCATLAGERSNIIISDRADIYDDLYNSLNGVTCITGKIEADAGGVRFPLAPGEDEGDIDPSYSRIVVNINAIDLRRKGFGDGDIVEICGLLNDATPFKGCNKNKCKWFELKRPSVKSRS